MMSDEITRYELPDGQLSLLPDNVTDEVLQQTEFAQGVYSGVQLKAADPEKYMTVCGLLADGSISQRQISRLTGCSRNLVSAINRQSSDIEPLKAKLAGRSRNVSELCMERIEELLRDPSAKVSLKDLMVGAAIGTDKFLLLSGEATQRVETIDSSSGADDFEAQFRELQQADAVEVLSMGCDAEELPPKGPDGSATAAAASDDDEQSGGQDDEA